MADADLSDLSVLRERADKGDRDAVDELIELAAAPGLVNVVSMST
ncbi:hypothetical protein [Streptomyces sp. NPDC058297]